MKIKPKDVGQGFLTIIIAVAVIAGVALMIHEILNTDKATRSVESVTEDLYYEVVMNVSAYCPCEKCCGIWAAKGVNSNGERITASGVPAKGKLIAAPSNYAFGTRMDVPGYGMARVQDRGGAIKGNKIDLLFPTHQEALNWGRKLLIVKVYKNN